MKTGRARPHHKRVWAAPKERRFGVPATLLVAAWSLFLLLLLTSSISHTDDEAIPQVLEESDFATQEELTVGRPYLGGDNHPHWEGEIYKNGPLDSGANEKSIYGDPYPEVHHSHISTKHSMQQPSYGEAVVLPTRITFQELGQPIDALQYAEYGAGLLQKSGPVEENFKICLTRNPGETSCRVIRNHVQLSGENCIWPQVLTSASAEEAKDNALCLPEDVLVEEHCYDASSYGGDIVAELKPGGDSYLVCQTDPVAERALCGVVCTTKSECLLSGVDPCHSDGSSSKHSPSPDQQTQHKDDERPEPSRIADVSMSSEPPNPVEAGDQQISSQSDVQDVYDLSSRTQVGSDSDSLGQQDLEESKNEGDEGNLVFNAEHKIIGDNVGDNGEISGDIIVEEVDSNGVKFLAPLVNSELTGRESLVSPAESAKQEEGDFDDELLSPLVVETTQLSREEPIRLKRVGSVMSLDEYKRTVLENQRKTGNEDLSSVQAPKVRHSDESYNYASASQGAKVLAYNKESKGASHVLSSDKDKYLRNPCGAEDKYVVIELSEESFVDTIVISNFEFHSSNLKDFEVLGSPVYPTKDWITLGKFQAENVRNKQKFTIEDPKLVRHLMIKMMSHWGNEFFCTLSIVEVFGVDVIQNLLEDWIASEEVDNTARAQGSTGSAGSQAESATTGDARPVSDTIDTLDSSFSEPLFTQAEMGGSGSADQGSSTGSRDSSSKTAEGIHADDDPKAGTGGESSATQELIHRDSVLKILMQRVKALELNQTLFDLYLEDLNKKYKVMLSELDKDLALVTDRLRNETILTASLAMRLADRELQRKEEKLYMEHRFAQIASNFTDNLDFMRWQIQSMERREITAILLGFLCMILSALLHLLASCLPKRIPPTPALAVQTSSSEEMVISKLCPVDSQLHTPSLSTVCQRSSTLVLYLACGLTILVLSV